MTVQYTRYPGWNVYTGENQEKTWPILRDCIGMNISQADLLRSHPTGGHPPIPCTLAGVESTLVPIVYTNPKRMVFRLDRAGERYIVKRAFIGAIGWWRFWPRPGMSRFSRIFTKVDRVMSAGVDVTQPYLAVAERWHSAFRQEVWLLLGYVEGKGMLGIPELEPHRKELAGTVREMLQNDLTMDDVSLDNFLLRDDGSIRTIDISCRRLEALQKAKMRVKMNARHGLGIEADGPLDRFLEMILRRHYGGRDA